MVKTKAEHFGMLSYGVRLLHANALTHSAHETVKPAGCEYKILPHPPYFPDLAPSDFFLSLRGTRFKDDDKVITEMELFLESQKKAFFKDGFHQLIHHLGKCVALGGDYVEKK